MTYFSGVMGEPAIREGVALYLTGELTLAQLEMRFPDAWVLDETRDAELRQLTLQIMGAIAEFDRGDIREAELRKRLLPFAGLVVKTSYSSSSAAPTVSSPPVRAFAAGTALPAGSS